MMLILYSGGAVSGAARHYVLYAEIQCESFLISTKEFPRKNNPKLLFVV